MTTETHDEFSYTMPKKLEVALMVASGCWFSIDGFAVLPIGFLFALLQVATKYEASYSASLKTGAPMVKKCAAVCALSFVAMAFHVGIASTGVMMGITQPLLRWLGH